MTLSELTLHYKELTYSWLMVPLLEGLNRICRFWGRSLFSNGSTPHFF
jgi:hypothetical protein